VALQRLVDQPVDAWFPLSPGDRSLVEAGDAVVSGASLAARLRDPAVRDGGRTGRSVAAGPQGPRPGDRWPRGGEKSGWRGEIERTGEHLFDVGGRWRVVTGELADPVESPVAGIVMGVRPGMGIALRSQARALLGAFVLGSPVRGRLEVVSSAGGELRASSIDVGRAGAILVVGARVDAEVLTRARAMGIRGIVVGGLPSKETRDFLASEARQRAARQGLPPFGVLVLGGALRRPIASPIMAILGVLDGRDISILTDPPALAIEDPMIQLPAPPPDLIRVRGGSLLGIEGRWAGLAGVRRFAGGVNLEAGFVQVGKAPPIAVPLCDLERFA